MSGKNPGWLGDILKGIEPPITIDKICAAFDRADIWPIELRSADIALAQARKAYARRALENFKATTSAVLPEWISLRGVDNTHIWKSTELLTDDDLQQKIEYCKKLIHHYRRQLAEFQRRQKILIASQPELPFGGNTE